MVNLDVNSNFTAAVPVLSGQTGPFSGEFPKGLVNLDANNVAPRVGFAWRIKPGTILRGGYGVSYNSGTFSTIARQLVGQPPFAVTNTSIGGRRIRLCSSAIRSSRRSPMKRPTPSAWTAPTVWVWSRHGTPTSLGTSTRPGTSASAIPRPAARASTSSARQIAIRMDCASKACSRFCGKHLKDRRSFTPARSAFRRRPVKGIGFGDVLHAGRSRDNASSLGGGGTVVAQNDQDLNAEWGLSSFDRRHQLAADTSIELPFGPNRPWLNGGGTWAALFRDWRLTTTFTWQSGTPLTARVLASVGDALRGTNGTLRADYNGDKIQVAGPDDRRVLQHVSVFEAGARTVRQFAAKPDHRAGQPPVERTVLAGRPDGRQPRHHASVERDEPAEHGELRDRGYGRELADVRPGPLRAADAFDAVHDEVSILVRILSRVLRV